MIVELYLQFSLYISYNYNRHLSLSRPYFDAIQNLLLDSTDTADEHRNTLCLRLLVPAQIHKDLHGTFKSAFQDEQTT